MKKVLIIEDDKALQAALNAVLRGAGYQVVSAFDAVMALSVARKETPDICVLDIAIPGGDAWLVAERLRALDNTTGMKLIFMTASKKPGIKERAAQLGVSAFLEKPFTPEVLLAAVEAALGE
ncbi:MAG: response regulator [Nevskiales bacterium]